MCVSLWVGLVKDVEMLPGSKTSNISKGTALYACSVTFIRDKTLLGQQLAALGVP